MSKNEIVVNRLDAAFQWFRHTSTPVQHELQANDERGAPETAGNAGEESF